MLNCFGLTDLELSATEISRKLKMPLSTSLRILTTLTKIGFLERSITNGKFIIGPELYSLGSFYLETTDVSKAARPVIKVMNELTREAISVGILHEGNLILIMKEESKHAFRFATHIGTSLPAHASSMGKALLSELDGKKIDILYPVENLKPITSKTISTKTELKLALEKIRATGISFNFEGGYEGVVGISSLIRNSTGEASAAMAISMQVHGVNDMLCQKWGELIQLGCNLISYRLGYQRVGNPVRDIEEIKSWWAKSKPDLAT